MLGKLTSPEIESVLATQLVGRIGCSANGLTYVVPVSYAYEDGCVYGHTKPGRKVDIMRKNPHVCFQVDELKDLANWKSVIAQGTFEELKKEDEIHHCIQALLNRYLPIVSSETMHLGRMWPFAPESDAEINGIVFRIRLGEKSGRFESASASPAIVG